MKVLDVSEELKALRTEVLLRIEAWQKEDDKNSINRLSTSVGISASVVSQLRTGIYQGDKEKMLKKIQAFFELEKQKASVVIDSEYVATSQAVEVERFATLIRLSRSIGVIVSGSGDGKTTALRRFAEDADNIFYICCNPCLRTTKDLLLEFAEALGISGTSNTNTAKLRKRITIKASDIGATFVLDEAQMLSADARNNVTIFELIRSISDTGVGFILAGNNRLASRISNAMQEEFYQQLGSRAEILRLSGNFSRTDVEAVAMTMITGKVPDDVLDYLHTVTDSYIGSLRIMVKIFGRALIRYHAQGAKGRFSVRYVEDAAKLILTQKKMLSAPKNSKKRRAINVKKTTADTGEHRQEQDEISVSATG